MPVAAGSSPAGSTRKRRDICPLDILRDLDYDICTDLRKAKRRYNMTAKAAAKAAAKPEGVLDKLSLYFPKKKVESHAPIERLANMAEKKDRSINYLVVEAILAYLEANE